MRSPKNMDIDLHSGRPVWLLDKKGKFDHKPLAGDIDSEVVIVGGGISGALLAYALVNQGMEVVLLDSREIGAGSTSASTAILSFETDDHLHTLIEKVGKKSAVRVFLAGMEAINFIENITKE